MAQLCHLPSYPYRQLSQAFSNQVFSSQRISNLAARAAPSELE